MAATTYTNGVNGRKANSIDRGINDFQIGGLTQGLLHLPGATHESKALMEKLLSEDRENHHCFWGSVGFHNHLNHHLLAAYDLGAPSEVLQAIYDAEVASLSPINLLDRKERITGPLNAVIDVQNWTLYLGTEKYYVAYVDFFKSEIETLGVHNALETYVFSPHANGNGSSMLMRFVGGALHPMIQVGYGVEFHDPLIVAAGLAQTAVSRPIPPVLHETDTINNTSINDGSIPKEAINGRRQPRRGLSMLSIISQAYSSEILHPVMPYDPDALLSKRMRDAMTDGRPEEIRRLASLWVIDEHSLPIEFDEKTEEMIWLSTLLTFSTGKHGTNPRLDFFLMHILTSSLFLPSLFSIPLNPGSKARLLKSMFMTIFSFIIVRGRPRIDTTLIMSYTDHPRPPALPDIMILAPSKDSLGDPREINKVNPWSEIVASVIHAPDAHTVKSLRTLYYGAQRYGTTPPGGAIGAFDENGEETLKGTSSLDGTIFIRAAGVLMDTKGWVTHGQEERNWDRSALGWDDAWNDPKTN